MGVGDWLRWFAFKQPTPSQDTGCIRIRTAVGHLAEAYLAETPSGPEQAATMMRLKAVQAAMLSHLCAPLPPDAFR